MKELEQMLELFPEEYPNINSAFRKLHANLMFRSARAMVSISGGADQLDPGLAKAARNIFGAEYEYTRAYRQFKAQYDTEQKSDKDQFSMFEDEI